MEQFDVFTYEIPKISDEGKSIPTLPPKTQQFEKLTEAQQYALQYKDKFDRVAVIHTVDSNQTLVERYIDGERIVPRPTGERVTE